LEDGAKTVKLSLSGIIIPERKVAEGILLKSTSAVWKEIAEKLGTDWTLAYQISPEIWEEIVAGAFKKSGYEVVLTPRSGDHGRDVIATRSGVGCVKIIGSVKAYRPDNLVPYDHVRSLIGVMTGERDVSKGIIMTTSDFPPNIEHDPFIAPFLPTRLELMNGQKLQNWLNEIQGNAG
jgi:restriction system protein